MKWLMIILFCAIAGFTVFLLQQGKASKTGIARGLDNGKLASCPASPNCICTEYPEDKGHFRTPLLLTPSYHADAIHRSASIVTAMGGVVTVQTADYLSATFTSKLFGFVDDFEVRQDKETGTLHVRSASRVGYSDMNVNRERTDLFFQQWAQ